MMWLVLLLLCCAHSQAENLKDSVKVILQGGSGPCEGYVEFYYKNVLGHVGDLGWNRSTEEVVCRSTSCGKPVDNATVDVSKVARKVWLNDLKCTGSEGDLLDCNSPGLGISQNKKTTVKKMRCSDDVKISLDGFRCSGIVQFSIGEEPRSGYVCDDKWGPREANHLCQSLSCGNFTETPKWEWMEPKQFRISSNNRRINCSGITNIIHLWQCVIGGAIPPESCRYPARVTCTGHERMQLKGSPSNVCSGELQTRKGKEWVPVKANTTVPHLKCQQMHCGSFGNLTHDHQQLTCSDRVSVVLMDGSKESKCYGTVGIKVNNSINNVCGNTWKQEESETVCRELGCGQVASFTTLPSVGLKQGIMDHVECKGDESSLWHCQAQRGKAIQCQITPSIICSKSVRVKLADGPGRCAGRLELSYANKWKQVLDRGWKDKHSDAVCQQLNCGERSLTAAADKYSHGSGSFLTVVCQSEIQRISECTITETATPLTTTGVVKITCEGHKVVFLKGKKACSGIVGIKHSNKTSWLSGSKTTWNLKSANAVCHQMQCGNASKIIAKPSAKVMNAVWEEAYDCSSTEGDLFDCNTTAPPPDHNHSIAFVTCSVNRSVGLSNGCWGRVEVCSGGECQGVCGESWTKKKSEMLCQSLGCGKKVLQAYRKPKTGNILYKSLHTTKHTNDLSQANFVIKETNDKSCDNNPAYVVCSGSVKPRFEETRDKCYGNVMMDYEGQPLHVHIEALQDIKSRNAICRQLNCGDGLRVLPYFGSVTQLAPLIISTLECSADDIDLWSTCDITLEKQSNSYGGLLCSDWKKMNFKETCKGEVTIYSKDKPQMVSTEGWSDKEGERLCKDMKCGKFKSKKGILPQSDEKNSFWNRSFSCGSESIANIWDCENETAPMQKEQLFIECQDEPNVTLSGGCHGRLKISNTSVCDRNWNVQNSHMVCQELGCGNALLDTTPDSSFKPSNSYYVKCDEHHYKLGQCKRVQGACDGSGGVSVYCVDNIQFNTTQHCGGVLQVKYQTEWRNVCGPMELHSDMKDQLCKEMGCLRHINSIKNSKENEIVNLEITLQCTKETFKIKYCVKKQACEAVPAEIYCDGYVEPQKPIQDPVNHRTEEVIGWVVFAIVLIVLVAIGGFSLMKKMRNSARMLPKDELESGSYAEVPNRGNERENLSRSRFGSDAQDVVNDNDGHSISSMSYDDVDKAPETRPLTGGSAIPAPANSLLQKDGVTYEIDDPQESYDDVGETEADSEDHDDPNAPTESGAAGPPGPEEEDENYIVPVEDG